MKRTLWLLSLLFVAGVAIVVAGCLLLFTALAPPDVTVHASVIPRDRDHYLSAVIANDPAHNAYCFDLNTYVSIPDIETSEINVANESGQVPVFRFDDAVFIILHKGRNYSRGLVLSDDASKMANEHRTIEFRKLDEGLYYWEEDGQRQLHQPDLYERELVTPRDGG